MRQNRILSTGAALTCSFAVLVIFVFALAAQEVNPFTDVSEAAGVLATHRGVWDPEESRRGYLAVGQAWGDYDNDGHVDLYLTGNLDPNVLLHNEGDGKFRPAPFAEQMALAQLPSGGALWADYDNDGWRDLLVLNDGPNVLWRNQEGVGFEDVTSQAGIGGNVKSSSAAWADFDGDGWLDLYVANWSCFPECDPVDFSRQQDRLYRNLGDGSFKDVTAELDLERTRGAAFAVSFVDFDSDGDADIYVVNDKLQNEVGNLLWRNDGPGCSQWCWTDVSAAAGAGALINGMGLAVGDYDNDLDTDFYFTEMVYPMFLLDNQGDGTFLDRALEAGVAVNLQADHAVGWGAAFLDHDNDGWLDLYMAASGQSRDDIDFTMTMHDPWPNPFFVNNRDGSFRELALGGEARATMGIARADYDNDGRVDIVLGNWNEGYQLWRNTTQTDNAWLGLLLRGGGTVNRDAIGARVIVTTADGLARLGEVRSGSGLGAGDDIRLHFGLGDASQAEVRILWPDGSEQVYEHVAAGLLHELAWSEQNTEA